MCGGDLEVTEGITVCECEYCGSKQTVPTIDDEKKIKLFSRANKLRANCEFDKAAGVYENIVADYSEDAEGYWGLILCRYGIEYVDDPATGKKIPTCHRSSFDSIMDDDDFEMVMENSDSVSRVVYREEAKYIEEIRKGIIEVSGKEEPYDIFICYKESDENGERTLDSVLAQDVYDELTGNGYRVFFSRITLEDKLGVEYEPYIFAALNSAKIMLVFGTSYDYYNAVWVKNEWSRYLKLMAKDKTKHLIPCFKNVDAYDIPKEFAKLQSQDMGKIGAIQDLMRGINKLIAPEPKTEKSPVAENIVYSGTGATGEAFLKRGFMAIEDSEWSKATEFFENVLNINPEDGQAYFGELLAEHKCRDAKMLGESVHADLIKEVKSEQLVADIENRYPAFRAKYFFMEVFSQDEIEKIFPDFYYASEVSSIEEIIEKNKSSFALSGDRLYQRAKQYSDSNAQEYLDVLHRTVEEGLAQTRSEIKAQEREEIEAAVNRADAYFEKLEHALSVANVLAKDNMDRHETEFQADHAVWESERDSFPARHAEWEKIAPSKKMEKELWNQTNQSALEAWNEEKRVYKETKDRLEEQLAKLEEERAGIYGFGMEVRRAKKDKEIMAVKIELSHLRVPTEPKLPPSPEIPAEIVLRDEPQRAPIGDMIEKEKVLESFYSSLEEMGIQV
jgi:hypothetical protein